MRSPLRSVVILSLMVGLMAFFLRSADLGRVWQEILRARWDLLVVSFGLTVASYLLRVERWRYMLRPIGNAHFGNAFRATAMGFAANAVLPGRVGEVLRPYVFARREGVSATAAFATIVLERLIDLLTVLLLLATFQLVLRPAMPAADARLLGVLESGAIAAGVVGLLLLGLVFVAAKDPARSGRLVLRLGRAAPGGLVGRVARLVQRFMEGLAVIHSIRPLAMAVAFSLPLWLCAALSIWAVSNAFGIPMSVSGSALMMGFVVLGVAVPTPAGIGGYHAAYQLGATALYAAPADSTVGAALVLHAITFLPVTLVGLVFMVQEGAQLAGVRRWVTTKDTDEVAAGGRLEPPSAIAVVEDEGSLR